MPAPKKTPNAYVPRKKVSQMIGWLKTVWARLLRRRPNKPQEAHDGQIRFDQRNETAEGIPGRLPDAVIIEAPSAPPRREVSPETAARRTELRRLAKQRRTVADSIDHILTRFENLNLHKHDDSGTGRRAYARANALLSNLMGCDFHFIEESTNLSGHEWHSMNLDHPDHQGDLAHLVEQYWPIDHATIHRKQQHELESIGGQESRDDSYFMERLYTVSAPEVRGRVTMIMPKMVHHVYGYMYDDGSWWVDDTYAGWIGGQWAQIPQTERTASQSRRGQLTMYDSNSAKHREEIRRSSAMAFSVQLTERYEWHVALGANRDGPRILLPTSPEGCRRIFKDRDKLGNASRRAALRHWVSRHYRERGEAGLSFVRQHLRGATNFQWRELAGEVLVSAFDLERNEEFKHEAELWRSRRQHNTFKLRIKRKA
jgi:hypothetical protein